MKTIRIDLKTAREIGNMVMAACSGHPMDRASDKAKRVWRMMRGAEFKVRFVPEK